MAFGADRTSGRDFLASLSRFGHVVRAFGTIPSDPRRFPRRATKCVGQHFGLSSRFVAIELARRGNRLVGPFFVPNRFRSDPFSRSTASPSVESLVRPSIVVDSVPNFDRARTSRAVVRRGEQVFLHLCDASVRARSDSTDEKSATTDDSHRTDRLSDRRIATADPRVLHSVHRRKSNASVPREIRVESRSGRFLFFPVDRSIERSS